MLKLSDEYKELCRFHVIGSGHGVPKKDVEFLETRMNHFSQEEEVKEVQKLIDECQQKWNSFKEKTKGFENDQKEYYWIVEKLTQVFWIKS